MESVNKQLDPACGMTVDVQNAAGSFEYQERGVKLTKTEAFKSITGKGVTGQIDGRSVNLGNLALLEELGIDPGELAAQAEAFRAGGQTVMFVAAARASVPFR